MEIELKPMQVWKRKSDGKFVVLLMADMLMFGSEKPAVMYQDLNIEPEGKATPGQKWARPTESFMNGFCPIGEVKRNEERPDDASDGGVRPEVEAGAHDSEDIQGQGANAGGCDQVRGEASSDGLYDGA